MKNYLVIVVIVHLLVSCASNIRTFPKNSNSNNLKDSDCPNLRIVHNISQALEKREIVSVDLLPILVDISLYDPDKSENLIARETIKNIIEPIVFTSLKENSIPAQKISWEEMKYDVFTNYRKNIRSASFALAHGKYETSRYFPTDIRTVGFNNYKLSIFLQVFPRKDNSQKIYLHLFLFDVKQKLNTYYEYFIYEECNISNVNSFRKVLDYMVTNFKKRNNAN